VVKRVEHALTIVESKERRQGWWARSAEYVLQRVWRLINKIKTCKHENDMVVEKGEGWAERKGFYTCVALVALRHWHEADIRTQSALKRHNHSSQNESRNS
jgi:hypothetical protein